MTDETDTMSFDEDVTDNVELSDDDTSDELDYQDPEEDQDTLEDEATEETDDEPDEAEAEDEAEGQEAEDEPEDPDTVTVKMDDGNEVQLSELKKGYLRQSDYTRKAQELSNDRTALKSDLQRMERINATFVEHLTSLIPDAPPTSLAYSDPDKFTAQKAQHEAAMAEVEKLVRLADEPKEITGGMDEAERQQHLQKANAELIEMFPEAAGGESRKQFFTGLQQTGSEFGFTDEELGSTTDPRIFAALEWARRGKASQQAAAKAQPKVKKAPPSTPRKPGQGARKASGKMEAMRKLQKDDSIENAIAAMSG